MLSELNRNIKGFGVFFSISYNESKNCPFCELIQYHHEIPLRSGYSFNICTSSDTACTWRRLNSLFIYLWHLFTVAERPEKQVPVITKRQQTFAFIAILVCVFFFFFFFICLVMLPENLKTRRLAHGGKPQKVLDARNPFHIKINK